MKADRISGFNISTFDHYVTFGVRRGDSHEALTRLAPKTDDLLDRIWKALGNREKGWKLNDVAQRTLGVCKVEDGANAPLLFQSGDWGKLCNYVADDVAIERDLTAFVDKYGFLIAGSGRLLRLPPWKPVGAV